MKRILKSFRPKQLQHVVRTSRQQQQSNGGVGVADLTGGRMASLDEGDGEENDNMDEYNDDYFHSTQEPPLPNQSHGYPESVHSSNFHDESAADDDTLYTSTSATRQAMDMDSYFNDTAGVAPSSSSNVANATTTTTTTTTTDRNGKRTTTTTVRIPPPTTTTSPNGRHGSAAPALPVSPAKSFVSTTAVPTVPIASTNLNHSQQTSNSQPLPPLRCDETRHLVKQFIAAIWNRGELEIIPDVCSPSLRFNGNTGTYSLYVLHVFLLMRFG
jgi:hypothetical protein